MKLYRAGKASARQHRAIETSVLRLAKALNLPVPAAKNIFLRDILRFARVRLWFTKKELLGLAEQERGRLKEPKTKQQGLTRLFRRSIAENRAANIARVYGIPLETASKIFSPRSRRLEREQKRVVGILKSFRPGFEPGPYRIKILDWAIQSLIRYEKSGRRLTRKEITALYSKAGK